MEEPRVGAVAGAQRRQLATCRPARPPRPATARPRTPAGSAACRPLAAGRPPSLAPAAPGRGRPTPPVPRTPAATGGSVSSRTRNRRTESPSIGCLVRRNALSAPDARSVATGPALRPQLVVADPQQPRRHVDAFQRPAERHEQVPLVARHGPLDDAVDHQQPLDHPVQRDAGAGREHHAATQRDVGRVQRLEHLAGQLVPDAAGVLPGSGDGPDDGGRVGPWRR